MTDKLKNLFNRHYVIVTLFVVLLIGAGLRFKGLTAQSYWLDELYTISYSNPDRPFSEVVQVTLEDVHPPLYQILLWFVYKIAGYSEFTGRALSVIAGLLSLVAIFYLGKEFFNVRTGLYSTTIMSVNYFSIYYSQECRSYSVLLLLSILSYLYFRRVLAAAAHEDESIFTPSFVKYLIATILLCYTHYFSFVLLLTQVMVLIFTIKTIQRGARQLLLQGGIVAAVFTISLLPLSEYIIYNGTRTDLTWMTNPQWNFFITYMYSYVTNLPVFLIFMGSLAYGVIWSTKLRLSSSIEPTDRHAGEELQESMSHNQSESANKSFKDSPDNFNNYKQYRYSVFILLIWLFTGYGFAFAKGFYGNPILTLRNTIILFPSFVVLIAFGMQAIPSRKISLTLLIITTVSCIAGTECFRYPNIVKDQWRSALQMIHADKTAKVIYATKTHEMKSYAKMLSLKLDIQSENQLKSDIVNNRLPDTFWVVKGDFLKRSIFSLIDKDQFSVAKKTPFKGTYARLYGKQLQAGRP